MTPTMATLMYHSDFAISGCLTGFANQIDSNFEVRHRGALRGRDTDQTSIHWNGAAMRRWDRAWETKSGRRPSNSPDERERLPLQSRRRTPWRRSRDVALRQPATCRQSLACPMPVALKRSAEQHPNIHLTFCYEDPCNGRTSCRGCQSPSLEQAGSPLTGHVLTVDT
jgi:hypothetical protein